MRVRVPPSISFIDVSFIFIIFFRGFGLVLAVTGKWFLSYVSFGSILDIAVKDYKKINQKIYF
nr:MAG TPA: hypothetical protein [Caudoviricetes sp.]